MVQQTNAGREKAALEHGSSPGVDLIKGKAVDLVRLPGKAMRVGFINDSRGNAAARNGVAADEGNNLLDKST
jgi:hypothetical protein